MDEVQPHEIEAYRHALLDDSNLNLVTVEQILQTLRVFLRYCERLSYCQDGMTEAVIIPELTDDEKARDIHLSDEGASAIIDWLCDYEWASINHLVFHIAYHTGMRRAALYGLDVQDWNEDSRVFTLRHRKNTPLKLDENSERNITVTDGTLANAINDLFCLNSIQYPECCDTRDTPTPPPVIRSYLLASQPNSSSMASSSSSSEPFESGDSSDSWKPV